MTAAQEKAAKQKAKEQAKKKGKKGKKGDEDEDYEDDEDRDAYTALSKMWGGNAAKPPVGSFDECARCGKQYTVVRPFHLRSSRAGHDARIADEVHDGRRARARIPLPPMCQGGWCGPV